MSGLQFITQVPSAYDSYQRRVQSNTSDDTRRFALNEQQRLSNEGQQQDDAMRRAVAEPAPAPAPAAQPIPTPSGEGGGTITPNAGPQAAPRPASPLSTISGAPAAPGAARSLNDRVAANMASVPGGGRTAVAAATASANSSDAMQEKFLELAATDPTRAEVFAQQNGMQIPPHVTGMIRNRKVMAALSGRMTALKEMYPGDHNAPVRLAQFQAFVKETMGKQRGGQPLDQTQMATDGFEGNMPKPVVRNQYPLQRVTTVGENNAPMAGSYDPATGVTTPGTVRVPATASGAAGRPPAQIQLMDYLIDKKIAKDPNEAWVMANTAKTSPTARAALIARVHGDLTGDFNNYGKDPAALNTQAQEMVDSWINGTPAKPGAGTPPPAVPGAPAAPGMAIPAELANEPEGTIVINDEDGLEYEIRGGQLVPVQ